MRRKMSFEDFEFAISERGFSIVCLNHYWLNNQRYTFCAILNSTSNKAFKAEGKDSDVVFDELYVKVTGVDSIKNGKVKIYTVRNRDVKGFWKKLGLKDVEKCAICGCEVTVENVGAFSPFAGDVSVCCGKLSCFFKFNERKKDEAGWLR